MCPLRRNERKVAVAIVVVVAVVAAVAVVVSVVVVVASRNDENKDLEMTAEEGKGPFLLHLGIRLRL